MMHKTHVTCLVPLSTKRNEGSDTIIANMRTRTLSTDHVVTKETRAYVGHHDPMCKGDSRTTHEISRSKAHNCMSHRLANRHSFCYKYIVHTHSSGHIYKQFLRLQIHQISYVSKLYYIIFQRHNCLINLKKKMLLVNVTRGSTL